MALVGRIELVIPTKDPGSIASFTKDAGAPLQDAALKAAGVEIIYSLCWRRCTEW
jgi:hypothetical protein